MRAIADRWTRIAPYLAIGKQHPEWSIGTGKPDPVLAELLRLRAGLLLEWVADDGIWPE